MTTQPTPPAEPRDPSDADGRGAQAAAHSSTALAAADRTGRPILSLEGLTRVHGTGAAEVHALRGIDLDVYPGSSSR